MTSQWCPIPKHWKGGQIFVPVKTVPREFSHVKNFFCSKDFCIAAGHVTEIHLYVVKINLVPRSLVDESALEIWIRDCVGMPKWGDREAIWEISLKKIILKQSHEAQFFHHKNTKVKANFLGFTLFCGVDNHEIETNFYGIYSYPHDILVLSRTCRLEAFKSETTVCTCLTNCQTTVCT